MLALSKTIFKAYDIRGVIGKTLDAGIARHIGRAFGAAALAKGEHKVVIGRDGRLSGPELAAALAEGLRDAGVDVIDLGVVATPMVYFGTHVLTLERESQSRFDETGLAPAIEAPATESDRMERLLADHRSHGIG